MSIWHFDSAIILPRGWVFAGKLHIKCSMSNFEIEGFLTHYSNVFLDFSCANVSCAKDKQLKAFWLTIDTY